MTLAEIARLAGVSRTTASYVINGKSRQHRISEATVKRVMAVIEEHGYRVDAQAAALRRGVSRTLGFVLPDLENTSYARLAKLLEQGARSAGYQLLMVSSNDDPDTERELLSALQARRCDALIVASSLPPGDSRYQRLIDTGMPIVAVDRALDDTLMPCIISENHQTAMTLTASVLSRPEPTPQPQEVLWLDALPGLANTLERRDGFMAAIRACDGQTPHAYHRCGGRYDRETGMALMREHLEHHDMPQALVTASYTLLEGALDVLLTKYSMETLQARALRMATFGNDRLLDFLPLKVNSMQQNLERIAALALSSVMEGINGRLCPGTVEVERTLIRRY
ncbi:catabolite repressor/activator [Kushneria marisflavi]|uniref:DNA-binding transcriptional regulator FruR n=1 Tax=Kushneria marisflavi TaxID=157779 RepID=A0A240ULH0_9GAMM|nr:catabolite repressor/activator [Kushneria marisflavi]ART62341.1 DNA-binding transcriptional regulator FruR [Kushneria marisflavi]RKD87448.1 LacI family transcriptional regulator [Kushneria marisflavi]